MIKIKLKVIISKDIVIILDIDKWMVTNIIINIKIEVTSAIYIIDINFNF